MTLMVGMDGMEAWKSRRWLASSVNRDRFMSFVSFFMTDSTHFWTSFKGSGQVGNPTGGTKRHGPVELLGKP